MGVQDNMMSVLAGPGRTQPRPPQITGPMRGVVQSVVAAGVMFTMPDFDGGRYVYGPAKWDNGGSPPVVGADCVILFLGLGQTAPWVVAWWNGSGTRVDGGTP